MERVGRTRARLRNRFAAGLLAATLGLPAAGSAATSTPLATWFGSQTCPALDGLYSKKQPPAVKTGAENLVVDVPNEIAAAQKISMTVPWYVYDSQSGAALSHVGGDSGVVWTLRVVGGPPPVTLPHVDLSGAHTTSGLKLGSSADAVIKKLGKPLIVRACGLERFEYSDSSDTHAEENDLDFTIRDGRVIEIANTSWG